MSLTKEEKERIEEEERYREQAREEVKRQKQHERNAKNMKTGLGCLTLIAIFIGLCMLGPLFESSKTPTLTPSLVEQEATEEEEYLTELRGCLENLSIGSYAIAEFAGIWPAWSDDDVIAMAATTILIGDTYDVMKELSPPEKFASVHQKFLKAAQLFADAMPALREGIDNLDDGLINQCTEMMNQATQIVVEATAELESLQ